MRTLVVGGAGFLGSHVVDRLLAEGHAVDVVDDLSTGSLANLAAARAEHVGSLKFHNLDVRVPELADLLVPAAAGGGHPPGRAHPRVRARDLLDVALGGTANLLDAAVAAGTTKVVVGLDAVALLRPGAAPELPVKEGTLGPPHVDRRRSPTGPWPTSSRSTGTGTRVEFTALALGHVYGTRQRPAGGRGGRLRRRPPGRAAGRGPRHGQADPGLRGRRRRRRRRGAGHDAGHGLVVNVGTGVQTSVDDAARAVMGAPRRRPPSAARPRAGRRRPVRALARPGPHPPGLGAVDRRGHRRGRAAGPAGGRGAAGTAAGSPAAPAEPSGRELVDGVAGADDAALHDTGVHAPEMQLPTDG